MRGGDAFDFQKIVPVINRTAQARKSLSTTHNIREVATIPKTLKHLSLSQKYCKGSNNLAERDLVSMVCITYILYKPGPVCAQIFNHCRDSYTVVSIGVCKQSLYRGDVYVSTFLLRVGTQ